METLEIYPFESKERLNIYFKIWYDPILSTSVSLTVLKNNLDGPHGL